MIRNLVVAAAFVACTCLFAVPATAQLGQGNSPNVLFSQYTTPAGPSATTAGMYPAPYNTLQLGSQSYYTYQPLMPHEMMYVHNRNYYNYYNSGGFYGDCNDSVNITKVRWQSGVNHMGHLPFGFGGHAYRHQARKYGLNQNCGGDCGGDCDGSCGGRQGFRHHRSSGCATGNCGVSTQDAGCATGGCAANFSDNGIINR